MDATTLTGDEAFAAETVVPAHLGRYRIEGVLGAGGMGVVLAAYDPELDRAVAIKFLRRDDPTAQERLVAEAQAMARLRHAHVVTVHDVGVVNGRVFIAMELVVGMDLRKWVAAAPRRWREVLQRMLAAARGLGAAHEAGIVHRDFKLDNVLVGNDGTVRVADFGLSSSAADETSSRAGTLGYMAPEQHDGLSVGPAADQFAFAVATWEALEGTRPFAGATKSELIAAKRRGPAAPRGGAPRWIFTALRRALAADPDRRYPSMGALIEALERGLGRRRRVALVTASLSLVAASAGTAFALSNPPHGPDCQLAGAVAVDGWNLYARNRLVTAFAASGRPHAKATIERVTAALDNHINALAAARVESCRATYDRGEQSTPAFDRRMACLDRRVGETTALIDVLGRGPDVAVIDNASDAVAALESPDTCRGTAGPDAPASTIATQVQTAQRRLAEATALRATGKFLEARKVLHELVVLARSLSYAPLLADVEGERARLFVEIDDAKEGVPASLAAAAAAASAGDDRLIALAWLGQLHLLTNAGGTPSEAFEHLPFVEVAVAKANDAVLREELLFARSDIQLELGRLAEARKDIENALKSLEARGATRRPVAVRILNHYVRVLFAIGENATAVTRARELVALHTELLGPDHLTLAKAFNNLGISLEQAGRYEEAIDLHQRAIAIKERTLGPDDPSVATSWHNLAMTYAGQGKDHTKAIEYVQRALAIRERRLGPDHTLVASSLANLSAELNISGRHEEALATATRAIAIRERGSGLEHPSVAFPLMTSATSLMFLDRLDEALVASKRALAIREKALGPRATATGFAWKELAVILDARQEKTLACAAYERAADIIEEADGPMSPDLIDPLTGRAQCRLAQRDYENARTAAEHVIRIVDSNDQAAYRAAPARFVLARVAWVNADRARASDIARTALAAYDANAPAATLADKASVEEWLLTHR